MKNLKLFLLTLLLSTFVITACKEEPSNTAEVKTAHELLAEHLVANGLDLNAILTDWIIGAPSSADASTFIETYNIIDIRLATDYTNGHIEGAVNSTLPDVITTANTFTENKPILVVCYTGQTAAHAVVALRLSGYTNAKVLKWGMASWGTTWATPWANNTNTLNHANWSSTVTLSTAIPFDPPTISTTSTTPANILTQQVEKMLTNGLNGLTGTEVLDNYSTYFINNFWEETDVAHYGHINGAYRIKPLTIADDIMYNLDPSKPIVTYCWTGQTSSMITAYLTVLGYNAYTLKFGANGMIYDLLESHKYVTPTENLPIVTK